MEATVTRLTNEQGIPLKEMMILTSFSRQKSHLRPVKELMSWSDEKGQALISTIHSAKGLERPVVLLAELERRFSEEKQRQDFEKYLYIACSRAQSHLIILLTKPLPRFLRDILVQEEAGIRTVPRRPASLHTSFDAATNCGEPGSGVDTERRARHAQPSYPHFAHR